MNAPLRIDMVSDIVCPWCILAYHQLMLALNEQGTRYEIAFHPYELTPDAPSERYSAREHLVQKYGLSEAQKFWKNKGIQGVPAVIFNGKHLVTGAQGVRAYKDALASLT